METAMDERYDVFLSHRSLNSDWVETLARNLERQGYRVFLDRWEIAPGTLVSDGVEKGLETSARGVLVASADVVESGWVRLEYEALLKRRVEEPDFRFVPLIFGEIPDLPFLDNVLCVDFRDASHAAYRRAFHQLLCGLEGRGPGNATFDGDLEFPTPPRRSVGLLEVGELRFLDEIFTTLASTPSLMLLAQADRGQGALIDAILVRARRSYKDGNVLHVTPPYSESAELGQYFRRLGRQCGFAGVRGPVDWDDALDERLDAGARVFLLVSGFENGSASGRRELAGVLRGLGERHGSRLRVVLCGGEGLAEHKYLHGSMSLLNHAEELAWPEPTVEDVVAWQARDFPGTVLDDDEARTILELAGGHPRLVRHLLQCRERQPESSDYRQALKEYSFVRELFLPYRGDVAAMSRICDWLTRSEIGDVEPWLEDELLRRLYWSNVLVGCGRCLRWRCEVLREAGRQVLRCP